MSLSSRHFHRGNRELTFQILNETRQNFAVPSVLSVAVLVFDVHVMQIIVLEAIMGCYSYLEGDLQKLLLLIHPATFTLSLCDYRRYCQRSYRGLTFLS